VKQEENPLPLLVPSPLTSGASSSLPELTLAPALVPVFFLLSPFRPFAVPISQHTLLCPTSDHYISLCSNPFSQRSTVSVAHNQLWSENIQWKIPEIMALMMCAITSR
jgi:hypothetical protein